MSNKINKICIESYFKTSGSDCDFMVELDEIIQTDENTLIYIDDVVIPNVFKTVETRNNKLYISIDVVTHLYNKIIELDTGYYNGFSFAQELTTKLKEYTDYIHAMRDDLVFDITATYDLLTNSLTFNFEDKRPQEENNNPDPIIITILSNKDLLYQITSKSLYNLQSINEIIGNIEKSTI